MKGFKPKNDSVNQNLQNDIKLYYCAYDGCDPKKSWGPGMIDHYKLFFVLEGQGHLEINNEVYTITSGNGFIIPPDTIVAYWPHDSDIWKYFWIGFNGMNAESYLSRASITKNQPFFAIADPKAFATSFAELFNASSNSKAMDLKSLGAFYHLLSILIDDSPDYNQSTPMTKAKDLYVNQAIEFMHTNYSRPIQIEDIAHYVNLDRRYLYQLFKNKMNLSLKQYLMAYRIEKAKSLLQESNLTIQQISASVGYTDPFLFSKTFKKNTGFSPTSYRARL